MARPTDVLRKAGSHPSFPIIVFRRKPTKRPIIQPRAKAIIAKIIRGAYTIIVLIKSDNIGIDSSPITNLL